MQIDAVRFPYLERCMFRYYMTMGGFAAQSVPSDRIKPFVGHDQEAYPSLEAFAEAAIADGWNNPFRKFLDGEIEPANSYLSTTWSYLSIFREIANSDEVTLFTLDDVRMLKHWSQYELLLDSCPDFDIVQIWWWYHEPMPVLEDTDISPGFHGPGDDMLIVTPKGAQRVLDWIEQFGDMTFEACLNHRRVYQPELLEGCYTTNKPSHWSHHYHAYYFRGEPKSTVWSDFADSEGGDVSISRMGGNNAD